METLLLMRGVAEAIRNSQVVEIEQSSVVIAGSMHGSTVTDNLFLLM